MQLSVPHFLFATGIENSNPTIQSSSVRQDEFDKCGHYVSVLRPLLPARDATKTNLWPGPNGDEAVNWLYKE